MPPLPRDPPWGTHSEKASARAAPKQTAQGESPLTLGSLDLRSLPTNLSRPGRTVVMAAWFLADDSGAIQPQETSSAHDRLAEGAGVTKRALYYLLNETDSYGLTKRVSLTSAQWILLRSDVLRKSTAQEKLCETGCGDKVGTLRGSKRCPTCLQGQRRDWKGQVLDIWIAARWQNLTDGQFLTRAHHKVRRVDAEGVTHAISLWGRAEDGVQGSGSGAGESLIGACVEMGIISDEWLPRARRARNGDGAGEE